MKKALSVILTIFTVAYLLFAPQFFVPHMRDNIYTVREREKQEVFTGILRLWNVSASPSAPRAQLNAAVSRTEKNNVHVFIETENLSPEQAAQRLQEGETPDLISFPAGFFTNTEMLAPLEENTAVIGNVAQTSRAGGALYAYPYMMRVVFPSDEELAEGTEERYATLSVYYIGATPGSDAKKQAMQQYFASQLVSEALQKNLVENEMVPVCDYEGLYETENVYSAIHEQLYQDIKLPNAFTNSPN